MDKKLEHIVIKYLNREFSDLGETKTIYPYIVDYVKDEKVYFDYSVRSKMLAVYDVIWLDLQNVFDLNSSEIRDIITKWVKETYHIKDAIPYRMMPIPTDFLFYNNG